MKRLWYTAYPTLAVVLPSALLLWGIARFGVIAVAKAVVVLFLWALLWVAGVIYKDRWDEYPGRDK